jgi:superfamily II DNA or RNA helicase
MDLEVEPKNWILPNRVAYNKYVYNTFNHSKYPAKQRQKQACACSDDVCEIPTVSLFPQQRMVRDMIQVNSPYRGIILYHELGSGKSAASIAAAEGYVGRKKVFVLSPASLAQNYENEILKISNLGLNLKKSWTQLKITRDAESLKTLYDKYAISAKFVKKDDLVWIPLYQNDISAATVITENKKYAALSNTDKDKINETMVHIIRNRYTFVSYNGLTQKLVSELAKQGFNDSFVVIDEVHNFVSRVVNGSKLARGIYNALMTATNCKLILLSGTPIINNPYEIATLINLIRGPMQIYELKLLKGSAEPNDPQIIDKLKADNLYQYIDEIHFNKDKQNIYVSLLPSGYAREAHHTSNRILKKDWIMTPAKTIEQVIASLKKLPDVKIGVVPGSSMYYALPNQTDEFIKTFMDVNDPENPSIKNLDIFQRRILGTLSYYKTTGTEFFPKVLPNSIQKLPMTDHQFNIYADVRAKERAIDNAQKRSASTNLFDKKSSVYRAFSRMVCNFAFPEEIKRLFPQDIRKLIMKDMVHDADDDEDDTTSEDLDKEAKKQQKKVKEDYENMLNVALKELMKGDYLNRQLLRQMYSPKYAQMLDDIDGSPGTVLIYSQFRTMEGLGIFTKVLNHDGYKEIVIRSTEQGYVFDDPSVFDKQYDNKRYVVFNSDRTKTNILMNLFNGSFGMLPDSILQQIPDEYKEQGSQMYGKLAKIMMITQSGAEGISLKNVRRVLIMEYFWNSVRISQVIGRAVRTCSHEMLPENERNVQIFTYIMSFTKKQMEKDFTLRTLDKEMTTDEYILDIAQRKEGIINQFLNMLKAASTDCITHSTQNKPLENGYKCYNWAINIDGDQLAYTEDIKDDNKILHARKFQVLKKNKGVVIEHNGKKYVMLNNKFYDYYSYKNAGILLPIEEA